MIWIGAALLGYFCLALSQILDKFLLTEKHVPRPATYAFYVSLFSAFSFVFSVFGLRILPWDQMLLFFSAGIIFTYALLTFYYAIKDSDITRVAPLQGLFTTLTVIAFAFLAPEFFGEPSLHWQLVWALALFVIGGTLISYDLPFRKSDHLPVSVIFSGFLMGVYLLFLKVGYAEADFVSGLVWSRAGAFLGAFSLLLFPVFRHQILNHQKKAARSQGKKKNLRTLALFIFNKTTAGVASFLIIYAVSLGSTSLVQALNGMQYVFLLLLVIPFAKIFPKLFPGHLSWSDWFQKVVALILIALGFYFLAISGVNIK
jgi:drug/metabolite transporter (DMT)-like permease